MEMHGMKSIMLIFVEEMQAVRSVILMNKQSKLFLINLKNQILLINGGLTTKSFILSQLVEELLGPMNTQIIIHPPDISSYGVKVLILKWMEELLSDSTTQIPEGVHRMVISIMMSRIRNMYSKKLRNITIQKQPIFGIEIPIDLLKNLQTKDKANGILVLVYISCMLIKFIILKKICQLNI